MRTLAIALLLTASADAAALDFGWLAGHWCSGDASRSTEELWTAPRGGLVLGVHRDVRNGKAGFFEFLRIEIDGEAATYQGQPGGKPAVPFRLTESGATHVVFENPAHDFPKRIRYSRDGDVLTASVDDGAGGNVQTWKWQKDCKLP